MAWGLEEVNKSKQCFLSVWFYLFWVNHLDVYFAECFYTSVVERSLVITGWQHQSVSCRFHENMLFTMCN